MKEIVLESRKETLTVYLHPIEAESPRPDMITKGSLLSGPLLDRIDLHIEVPAVKYKELGSKSEGESSHGIRQRVIAAREIQMRGFRSRN